MHEHRLGLVIPVMRCQDRIHALFLHQTGKNAAAFFTSQRFHARIGHAALQSGVLHPQRHPELVAQAAHKALVLQGILAAQTVLHMHGKQREGDLAAHQAQRVKQRYAVQPAAHRAQKPGVWVRQTCRCKRPANGLCKRVHGFSSVRARKRAVSCTASSWPMASAARAQPQAIAASGNSAMMV